MIGGMIIDKKKTPVLGENSPLHHFVNCKCHADCPTTGQASAMRSLSYGTALLHPLVGGVKGMDVISYSFSSCHHPAIATGNFLWKWGMDKIDYENWGI
jgi:hypothetical protein